VNAVSLQQALQPIQRLLAARRHAEALDGLEGLIKRYAGHPALLFLAARSASELERVATARRYLRRLLKAPVPTPEQGVDVVRLFRDCGLWREAQRYLDRLEKAHPKSVAMHVGAAAHALALGDLDAAGDRYDRALALDPACAAAWHFRARDRDRERDVGETLAGIDDAMDRTQRPADRALLHFARGRCLDRAGEHRAAFEAFDAANRDHRADRLDFGLERKLDAVAGFVAEFDRERLAAARDAGHGSRRPVLIVGMPRSGTTLLDRIIAAHPDGGSAGERRIIGNLVRPAIARAARGDGLVDALVGDGDGLKRLGDDYLGRLDVLVGDQAQRVVDKLPFNFALAAPAHLVFPHARLIHARRDRHDVCWSMFTTSFASPYLRFTLAEIGRLQAMKDHLMACWDERFGEAIHTVDYEHVVDDFEVQVRALLDALGLPFDPACLEFHRRASPVTTASVLQVRRPLYRSSAGRSAPYRAWLGDFDAAYESTRKRLQDAA